MLLDSRITEATAAVRDRLGPEMPRAAIILGSGLGGLAAHLEDRRSIPFTAVPHVARSTAAGHRGEFVAGVLGERKLPVVAMAGRLHRYEGWSVDDVTFPVAVLAALGAKVLIVSNAAGGLNPHFRVGDIMILRDHINWMPPEVSHDRGPAVDGGRQTAVGYRCCGSWASSSSNPGSPYDAELATAAFAAARRADFAVHPGTYLATLGPNYETRAEYRMMRRIGADAVGMSTVPEVLKARRLGMRVLAMSLISNVAFPKTSQPVDHQHVLEAGQQGEPKLRWIVDAVLRTLE